MKTAVSIPDDVFAAADRLARRRKVSRSALYTDALRLLLDEANDGDDIRTRLDEVYAEIDSHVPPSRRVAQAEALREEW